MKNLIAAAVIIAPALGLTQQIRELPTARITIRAMDENGQVLAGAAVALSFEQPIPKWGGGDALIVKGATSVDGEFSASGHSFDTKGGQVTKQGYYSGWARSIKFEKAVNGKWQPWNPTVDVILKKIINPIPMYARHVEVQLPAIDAPVGFDLVECDWVSPNGRGKVSDLVFRLTKRVVSFHDFGAELRLTFSNNADGIQAMLPDKIGGSALRSPHNAPDQGYSSSLPLLQGNSKEHGEYGIKADHQDYFFRVRSVTGSRGEIVSGLYAKIYRGIEYYPVSYKTAKLRFTYYLNPTPNDRNIEFDPKRNLFTNLKPDEQVTEP